MPYAPSQNISATKTLTLEHTRPTHAISLHARQWAVKEDPAHRSPAEEGRQFAGLWKTSCHYRLRLVFWSGRPREALAVACLSGGTVGHCALSGGSTGTDRLIWSALNNGIVPYNIISLTTTYSTPPSSRWRVLTRAAQTSSRADWCSQTLWYNVCNHISCCLWLLFRWSIPSDILGRLLWVGRA